ncbi:MAG: hypothetical protein ACRCU3_09145 [Eubacteriaceae bacterium]
MKRTSFRNLSITFCFLIVFFISGCGEKNISKPEVPEFLKLAEKNNSPEVRKVNLYYDNTQSMYGFVQNNPNNQTPKNFIIATDALYDTMAGYQNANFYKLGITADSPFLKWLKIPDNKMFQSGYKTKDFYTFSEGIFEGSKGPLQLLFENSTEINFDDINVFITDLAEQNLQNNDLARMLNKVNLEREGYSTCVFAINSYFYGTASVPTQGVVDAAGNLAFNDFEYDGMRTYYCVMTGPTEELANLGKNFASSLQGKGLNENSEFFFANFLSTNGIIKLNNEEIIKTNSIDFFKGESKGITPSETNETANLFEINPKDFFENVDREYPCISYKVDTTKQNPDNRKEGVVNLFLPIKAVEGINLEEVDYLVDSANVQIFYSDKNEIEPINIEEIESVEGEEGQEEGQPYWKWSEMSKFDAKEIYETAVQRLNFEEEVFNISEEKEGIERISIHKVENVNGELALKLKIKDLEKLPSSYNIIKIPVVAVPKSMSKMPEWINQGAFALKTENLVEFYKVLSGDMASVVEKQNFFEKQKAKVGEIVINIESK